MAPGKAVKIVAPGDDPIQVRGSPHLERLERYGGAVVYSDRPADDEEKLRRVRDAAVIINSRSAVKWPGEALRSLPKLRMIATCSIGTDAIDVAAATELGIVVSNQPGRTAGIVAEHIFGLMFAVAKRAAFQTAELKAGRWTRMDNVYLRGKTLGVIGAGNVGAEVVRLANAVGMRVIAWTFHPSPDRARALGVELVGLEALLEQSDVVSLHVSLTEQSRGMIGARELGSMKDGALLVNGGRAALVDTGALVEALDAGRLGGAAIDVFDVEPAEPDNPLLSCSQVVLTPHVADQTPEGMELLNSGPWTT